MCTDFDDGGGDRRGEKRDAPIVPSERRPARKRRQQIVTPRQRRQPCNQQCQRDIHSDHGLSIDQLPPLGKLEDLARGDTDGGPDDAAEDDLVEEAKENPIPDGVADRVVVAEEEEEGEILW